MRLKISSPTTNSDNTYDSRDRLLSEQITDAVNGNRTTSYTYDAVGNRLTMADSVAGATSYTYNNNDWLVTETQGTELTQYTYDNNGSLLSKFHNANDKVTYTWNLDRRLAGVQTTDSSGTHQSTYTYDADGNRVRQTVDGVSTNYLVDTNRGLAQIAAEYDSSGVKASYTYAGGVISQISNNVTSFYVNDGHSGVRLITSNTGAVTDAYNYDGYGNLLQSVGNASNERYRGETSDSATGLQYLRARYYDPSTGRFLSTDAFEGMLESPVSRHRYLYGNNNPLTYADPSGNFSMAEVGTVLSIIETLTFATVAQFGLAQIARRFGKDIIWDGKLSSVTGKTGAYEFSVNVGLSLLDLTTRENDLRSPYLYPGLTSKFRGKWLQVYGGVGVTSDLSIPLASIPFSLSIESSVVAWSPGVIEATPLAFAGTFFTGSVTVGPTSPKTFSAGFGYGVSSDPYGTPAVLPSGKSTNPVDAGISFKEGISIPVYFSYV